MRRIIGAVLATTLWCASAAAVDPNGPAVGQPPQGGVDLTHARALVKAKDWRAAVSELSAIVETTSNADAFNLLAFSLRNQGHHDAAFIYYFKALDLDPEHKGAREYLGELYLKLGRVEEARAQLRILERLCPEGCEERTDLEAAFAAASLSR